MRLKNIGKVDMGDGSEGKLILVLMALVIIFLMLVTVMQLHFLMKKEVKLFALVYPIE